MATRTLNQIRIELRDFAASHGQLMTGRFSSPINLLDDGDVLYPAFYYNLTGATKIAGQLVYAFTGLVADRVNPERDNLTDVWNDTTLIACDILAFLNGSDREYRLNEGITLRPFEPETTADNAAGVSFDFTLTVNYPYDHCMLPTKETNFLLTEEGKYFLTEQGYKIQTEA